MFLKYKVKQIKDSVHDLVLEDWVRDVSLVLEQSLLSGKYSIRVDELFIWWHYHFSWTPVVVEIGVHEAIWPYSGHYCDIVQQMRVLWSKLDSLSNTLSCQQILEIKPQVKEDVVTTYTCEVKDSLQILFFCIFLVPTTYGHNSNFDLSERLFMPAASHAFRSSWRPRCNLETLLPVSIVRRCTSVTGAISGAEVVELKEEAEAGRFRYLIRDFALQHLVEE
ncbi:hypothetical protein POM88_013660 [Heracleum sosnowskyi]|uniref:Uncharacterized protein n=1 Tax=Heracleum sosnowskyi TaxID=360622 RepID=A0AAD8J0G8_9APIA|nr:hypothetical protein POM88_013660 [Heracleum sosnowskyi]